MKKPVTRLRLSFRLFVQQLTVIITNFFKSNWLLCDWVVKKQRWWMVFVKNVN